MADADPKPGKLPKMTGTMRAEVLAVLLSPDDQTGVESIFGYRKPGLAVVVRTLVRRYHWPIERRDFPTSTGDGRSAWASVYCLPQEVIDAALDAGGRDWLAGMKATRAARARQAVRR